MREAQTRQRLNALQSTRCVPPPPPSSPARARRRPNHASRTATALVAQCRTIILHVAGLRPMHTGNTDFAEQWKGTATPIDEPNDLQTSWWVVPVL